MLAFKSGNQTSEARINRHVMRDSSEMTLHSPIMQGRAVTILFQEFQSGVQHLLIYQ